MIIQTGTPPDEIPSEVTTTTDLVFETLANRHRRRILTLLAETGAATTEDSLDLDSILAMHGDSDVIQTALYHNHLPRLDNAGIIEWNRETESIARGPQYDEIEPVVELLLDHRDQLPGEWP